MTRGTVHTTLLIAALSIAATINLQAAPSLPITKGPVTSGITAFTGPNMDPTAAQGQWFTNLSDGIEEYRPYEFHDNTADNGGGSYSVSAISGFVVNGSVLNTNGVPFSYGDPIASFKIEATIYNDTDTASGDASDSSNQHEEYRQGMADTDFYVGTLVNTKLTAEFAVANTNLLPQAFIPPYYDHAPYIIAEDEDQLAWYCWNEQYQEGETGNYYVPTWDFGNIPTGSSFTRTLSFTVDPPMPSSDPRYEHIHASESDGTDLFANRTTSLKISTWIENLEGDNWMPYPEEPLRGSDVSVFHEGLPDEDMDYGDAPDPGYPT
ncbi:MAG: hypothetical protein K9M45_04925 [Kiritimatiellales bacterium]|nr:hypothetical protein [Kiritimatiellales bacterium]